MKKRLITMFMLFVLIIGCFNITAFAEDKEYTIESAQFYIEINDDGSATVSEFWTVTYEKGSFSRFYKNIYTSVPKDENFIIEFEEVLVDGKSCTYTGDTSQRVDYTYSIVENYDTTRYEIYMNSENETRNFVVTYTLYDVIKCVNNDYYLFKYRLLPMGFKENISEVYVSINFPDYTCESISLSATKGKETLEDYGATVYAKNVSDLYQITFKFDGPTISGVLIDKPIDLKIDNADGGLMSFIISAIFVFIFHVGPILLIVLFFGIAIFLSLKQTKQLKEELATNPYLLVNLYQKWVPKYFTPAEFACILTENKCLSYAVCLAELVSQGIVKINPDYQYIVYPIKHNNHNILQVLDECRVYAIKKKMPIESNGDYWLLPVQYIEIFFKKSKGYDLVYKNTYKTLLTRKNIKDKELLRDIQKMRSLASIMHLLETMPIVELSDVIQYYNYSYNYVPYYCFQKQDKDKDVFRDDSFYLTVVMLSAYQATHGHSSSSSSGCSSCSSCGGGCGGCGGCGGSD
jgi:hypothetical protein